MATPKSLKRSYSQLQNDLCSHIRDGEKKFNNEELGRTIKSACLREQKILAIEGKFSAANSNGTPLSADALVTLGSAIDAARYGILGLGKTEELEVAGPLLLMSTLRGYLMRYLDNKSETDKVETAYPTASELLDRLCVFMVENSVKKEAQETGEYFQSLPQSSTPSSE